MREPGCHLEDVFDSLADTFTGPFADLSSPLRRADADVLTRRSPTLSNGSRGTNRVPSDQIPGALSCPSRQIACALACTLSNISASASDVATGAAARLGVGCVLSRRTLIRARLALRRHNNRESEQHHEGNESKFNFHGGSQLYFVFTSYLLDALDLDEETTNPELPGVAE